MVADRVIDNKDRPAADVALKEKQIYSMILKRNHYYRNNLRFLIMVMLMGVVTLLFLWVAIINLSMNQQKVYYIPAHQNGIPIKSEDLTLPQIDGMDITDDRIINWALNAIPTVYNFNFLTSEGNFRSMIHLFTPEGFRAYRYALEMDAKILDTLAETKTAVQGFGCGAHTVTILSKGVSNVEGYPVYNWQLLMPMIVINANKTISNVYVGNLYLNIQRVQQTVSKSGLAIYSFVFKNNNSYPADANENVDFDFLCRKWAPTKVEM